MSEQEQAPHSARSTDDAAVDSGRAEDIVAVLSDALAFPDVRIIVRAHDAAIAEVIGPRAVGGGEQWLRIGEESASHVHLKRSAIRAVRFVQPDGRNAAVEVVGADQALLLRVSFGRTNPARAEKYLPERRRAVEARFGSLAESGRAAP
ncbi:MAG: hypothetical protein MJE77_40045 [Proteobacteria bacterium]|nr:hypothetical protein [Pseudomonadota bacterium]